LDLVFCQGSKNILRVALALLKQREKDILATTEFGELHSVINSIPKHAFNCEELIKYAVTEFKNLKKIDKVREKIKKELQSTAEKLEIKSILQTTIFTENQINEIRKKFKQLSIDEGHNITYLQFTELFAEFSTIKMDKMFTVFDQDQNGLIDFNELMLGLSTFSKGTVEQKLKMIFKSFDLNGDNLLDKSEITQMFQTLFSMLYQSKYHENILIIESTLKDLGYENNPNQKFTYPQFLEIFKKNEYINLWLQLLSNCYNEDQFVYITPDSK